MKRPLSNATDTMNAGGRSIRLKNNNNGLMNHVLFILTAIVFNRQNIHVIL
jgi:hypothetical protein